jgi:threonine dehydrogenase-like Zn-dependent dehydrogenase
VLGLQELLDATYLVVPEAAAGALTAAQQLDLERKRQAAKRVILSAVAIASGVGATPIPFADAVLREVVMQTTVAHVCNEDMPEALSLLASGTVAKLLTDRTFSLEKANEAFELLVSGKANGKILVTPQNV